MACVDPFPAISKDEAERLLSQRVRQRCHLVGAAVYIRFPSPTGRSVSCGLPRSRLNIWRPVPSPEKTSYTASTRFDWPTD